MNFTDVLGFVVFRDVAKVFQVRSPSFARKATGRNRARSHSGAWRGLKTKWDLKMSRVRRISSDTCLSKSEQQLSLERFRADHFTCKNTDWEKWREPISKVEPETTDWALHTRIPVRIEPSHFLTAAECWSIASEDTQSGDFYFSVSFFFSFFPFLFQEDDQIWEFFPGSKTCFQFIYLFIY